MKSQSLSVPAGGRFHLDRFDPDSTGRFKSKTQAGKALEANLARLNELQELLYADGRHALLVVLQGMDTSGKDGAIEHVAGAFNPQGVSVTSFKVPTAEELAHDFLWRVHKAVPPRGMVGIFNRSHYEDVLVVRVRKLAPNAVWRARFEQINAFEKLLAASGVAVVKFFLHISRSEQRRRLEERQKDPGKQWKFNPGDLEERERWDDYMTAYEDALTRCNTADAPWFVVPADHKWYRNLVVSQILVERLGRLKLRYPPPPAKIGSYVIPK